MNKIDYNAKMIELLQGVDPSERVLLHSCCGPCSTRCLEALCRSLRVTVFYFNPNITDEEEYGKRKAEQLRFLRETKCADFLDCAYEPERFFAAAKGLEAEKEGGARCYQCYRLRLEETAKRAKELGYDWFCSTLSVSPHKNSQWLNTLGEELEEKYRVRWLYNDFKKQNGYLRSVELAKQYGLYRQNYCGCIFSDWTRQKTEE